MFYTSQVLNEIPSVISPDDHRKLEVADTLPLKSRVVLYQEMIDHYSDFHPFLLVRLADSFVLLEAGTLAMSLYQKAQGILSSMEIVEHDLDAFIRDYGLEIEKQDNATLARAQEISYYQTWKPTKLHAFPTRLPQLPPEAQEIKNQWQELSLNRSSFLDAYLRKLAIETNHIESTFFLTQKSIQDLTQHGFSEGIVDCLPECPVKDPPTIREILKDTLAAYELQMSNLHENMENIDKNMICSIHSTLMKTCQFSGKSYTPAGITRTETHKTVIVAGFYNIECCPFLNVDDELQYLCRMAKQWIKTWRNPFATASWIHLVLVRCHPFEDGNGRLARLLASLPLLKHGCPPISILPKHQADYYLAINKAYDGDHSALEKCILDGMKDTISSVEQLLGLNKINTTNLSFGQSRSIERSFRADSNVDY